MADESNSESTPAAEGVFGQFRALWDKLSPRRKAVLATALIGTLVFIGALSFGSSVEPYGNLYTGMTPEDAGEVVSMLKEKGIPYKLSAGGSNVMVPKDKLNELRISMASAGFPRGGGVGFEIFDKQSFGTTNFVEQVNYRRALQGELARSISSVAQVKSARIHIAMGKRSVFRDADEPPSASVALRLKTGQKLSADQVRGIVHLVASSVDGLASEKVVVIDERGRVLSAGEEQGQGAGGGTDMQSKIEESLAERVRTMVEKVVGVGNAAVVVTAQMDYSRVDQTEEMYDKDKIAVRSEVRNVASDGAGAGNVGGIAGARANLDGAAPAAAGGNDQGSRTLSETRNYEVPRIVRHTQGPQAKVKRLHVAVLVDHKSVEVPVEAAVEQAAADAKGDEAKADDGEQEDKADEEPAAEPEMKIEKKPLSEEELAVIAAIAKEAAGLDDERGDRLEVRNVPFEEEAILAPEEDIVPPAPFLSKNVFYAGAGLAGLVLTIIVLLLIRRKSPNPRVVRPSVIPLPASITEVERALETSNSKELPAPSENPAELSNPQGDLYVRVLESVRSDAGHAARVFSALLDEPTKEGA